MRTGRLGRVCGGAVDDDLVGGTAGGLVDAAAVLIHLPASVESRGAALALQAQGAEGYEEELVARLRGFRPDFGLVATCFGRAPETRRHQSKVRAEASQPRDQLLLVAFGALRLECQGGAPRLDGRRQVNQNGGCVHQPARGAAHEVVVDGAATDAPEAPGPHVAACVGIKFRTPT